MTSGTKKGDTIKNATCTYCKLDIVIMNLRSKVGIIKNPDNN